MKLDIALLIANIFCLVVFPNPIGKVLNGLAASLMFLDILHLAGFLC